MFMTYTTECLLMWMAPMKIDKVHLSPYTFTVELHLKWTGGGSDGKPQKKDSQ